VTLSASMCRNVMQPLGGPGDKVFPPTYGILDNPETRYAVEERYVPSGLGDSGSVSRAVVLDSVASQANRLELALLDAIRRDDLAAPVTSLDFRPVRKLAGLDRISDYEPRNAFSMPCSATATTENICFGTARSAGRSRRPVPGTLLACTIVAYREHQCSHAPSRPSPSFGKRARGGPTPFRHAQGVVAHQPPATRTPENPALTVNDGTAPAMLTTNGV